MAALSAVFSFALLCCLASSPARADGETSSSVATPAASAVDPVENSSENSIFGPRGCITLSRTEIGTCMLTTDCLDENLTDSTEFAFVCVNPGSSVPQSLHSFGRGGFEQRERFDTGVSCVRCITVTDAFRESGPLIRNAMRALPAVAGSDFSTSEPFDCYSGYADGTSAWSSNKKSWCCQNKGVGCSISTPRFDCNAGYDNWEAGWSGQKKTFCCQTRGIGCPTTSTEPFDCDAGYANREAGWSSDKKTWCCQSKSVGCLRAATSEPFDCSAEIDKWDAGWSSNKKAWCCQNKDVACPRKARIVGTSKPFDCNAGKSNWEAGWSANKKLWCCNNQGLGCDPFDCTAGYGNWAAGWSDDKKLWCCRQKGRGCSQMTTSEPYDCVADAANWESVWSPRKKTWCCQNQKKGCPSRTTSRDAIPGSKADVREMPPEAAFYGPEACIVTFRSPAGSCIVQTRCAKVDISSFNVGVTCMDKAGGYARFLFGKGTFKAEETFDSRLKCELCLGVGTEPTASTQVRSALPKTLMDDVSTLKSQVKMLRQDVRNILGKEGQEGEEVETNLEKDGGESSRGKRPGRREESASVGEEMLAEKAWEGAAVNQSDQEDIAVTKLSRAAAKSRPMPFVPKGVESEEDQGAKGQAERQSERSLPSSLKEVLMRIAR